MLMARIETSPLPLKGRPPLRQRPDDFEVIFVEQGRVGCEPWYRARRDTVTRWMKECDVERLGAGLPMLIAARAAFVAHQRSQGNWITRQTPLVTRRDIPKPTRSQPIRDRRKVSFTLARHAAQYLRIVRHGGFIVSPTPQGDWWVGSRRLSAAQMLELARSKGFDERALNMQDRAGLQSGSGGEVEG
jgi:hypothetical protein